MTVALNNLREATGARILNMYGPTETTIWSTAHPVQGDETGVAVYSTESGLVADALNKRVVNMFQTYPRFWEPVVTGFSSAGTAPCQIGTNYCTAAVNSTGAAASMVEGTETGLRVCPDDDDFYSVVLSEGDDIDVTLTFSDAEGDIDPATVALDPASVPGGAGSDTDGDGDIDTVVVPGQGTWTVDESGNVTFTPCVEPDAGCPAGGFNDDPDPI